MGKLANTIKEEEGYFIFDMDDGSVETFSTLEEVRQYLKQRAEDNGWDTGKIPDLYIVPKITIIKASVKKAEVQITLS